MSMHRLLLLTFSPSLIAFCMAQGAEAQELTVAPRSPQNVAPINCAALGPGYVPLHGARGCARIGGHVRVRIGDAMPLAGGGPAPVFGFPAPHPGDGPMRAHLRIEAGPR